MIFEWIPYLEVEGPTIKAPNLLGARAIAERLHGKRVVRVQSLLSATISKEERLVIRRARRLQLTDLDGIDLKSPSPKPSHENGRRRID